VNAAAQQSRGNYDYGHYQYQYGQSQHADDSYSQKEYYDVPVEDKKCYLCEYTFLASQNHEEGSRECMDPFSGVGVHEMECNDNKPCMVCYPVYLFQLSSNTEFVSRVFL